jgi:hypothetical protein
MPTSHAAVTGHAIQPSGHVHPSTVIRSIRSPDDMMTAAAANSISSFGAGPSPRTSSMKPARKISPPAIKNGRIAGQARGSMVSGTNVVTRNRPRSAARTTATPPMRGTERA